jgi:hypothetical protein
VQVDIGGWIGDGFKHLSDNWGKYVRPYLMFIGVVFGGALLFGCMGGIGSFGVGLIAQNLGSAGGIISMLFALFMGVLSLAFAGAIAPLAMGLTKAVQGNLRGDEVPSNVITGEFKNFIPAVLLLILIGVGVTSIGTIACCLPRPHLRLRLQLRDPDHGGPWRQPRGRHQGLDRHGPGPADADHPLLARQPGRRRRAEPHPLRRRLVAPIVLFTLQNVAYLRLSGAAGKMGDDGILRNAGF